MNKRKKQAVVWIIIWSILTLYPFVAFYYVWNFGGQFIFILSPFALFMLIKVIREWNKGFYD
jgi:hypothetical protein